MKYETLLTNLRELVTARMEHYLKKRKSGPKVKSFSLGGKEDTPLAKLSKKYSLSSDEQLLLTLTFVPHLDPDFYASVIRNVLPAGGDLPIFGAVKGKNHRGFLPTGETALFIIAGTDLEKRLELIKMISGSPLIRQNVISIEPADSGEPKLSGKLSLAPDIAEQLLTGERPDPAFGPGFPAEKIETALEWDDLVLTPGVLEQIDELKMWIEHNDQLFDKWGMRGKIKPGYRVLFHGPPGTGKTMTATLLGKYTGRDVFRVDLSTVVSKYIGETEKNLSSLFSKAESRDWILFFDEADALFGKRTQVSDSHDRYANQEVSYLLQRVESFSGLVILSSNYKSNLDEAFMRRFNSVIKFPFPDAPMREKLWKKAFPKKMSLGKSVDLSRIASSYKLSGGEIMNAAHLASLKIIAENKRTVIPEKILHGIRREVEKEGKVFNEMVSPTVKEKKSD